ncbi:MAG: hypothetical protein PWP24_1385 [Clostridiales bacterium]|nr:hypothetical protein [Clostridiales bacterium]
MEIKNIKDTSFHSYGRVLTKDYKVSDILQVLGETEAPSDAVIYVPSDEKLENLKEAKVLKESLFGGLPIQVGYCNGTNQRLDALEYHRNSEIGVAWSDLILLLGKQQDIEADYTYQTSKVEAFLVPAGEVYELYATTLHYAPVSVNGGAFRNLVVLPKGTNTDLLTHPDGAEEDKLLFAKNKWLISHEEANIANSFVGLNSENIIIK